MFRRSFLASSWWNTPATGVPVDPNSDRYLANLKATERNDRIGVGVGDWAMFFGDADHTGPLTTITDQRGKKVALHVPDEVVMMEGNDKAAVFRCRGCDKEVSVFEYDVRTHRCAGFAAYTLSTTGIAGTPGNAGHRGIPPSSMFIAGMEISDGVIRHRLKMAVSSPSDHRLDGRPMPIWPMDGYERGHGSAIPEGAVLRLRRSAFDRVNPLGAARVVATAARDYGFIVGETGGVATVKYQLNATAPSGLSKALNAFGFADYEVLVLGWGKP